MYSKHVSSVYIYIYILKDINSISTVCTEACVLTFTHHVLRRCISTGQVSNYCHKSSCHSSVTENCSMEYL